MSFSQVLAAFKLLPLRFPPNFLPGRRGRPRLVEIRGRTGNCTGGVSCIRAYDDSGECFFFSHIKSASAWESEREKTRGTLESSVELKLMRYCEGFLS